MLYVFDHWIPSCISFLSYFHFVPTHNPLSLWVSADGKSTNIEVSTNHPMHDIYFNLKLTLPMFHNFHLALYHSQLCLSKAWWGSWLICRFSLSLFHNTSVYILIWKALGLSLRSALQVKLLLWLLLLLQALGVVAPWVQWGPPVDSGSISTVCFFF